MGVQCLPGDLVIEEGQLVEALVFVISGRLSVQESKEEHLTERQVYDIACCQGEFKKEIMTGAWFGEVCLFGKNMEFVHASTIVAVTESELAVLSADEFFKIIMKYPRLMGQYQTMETRFNEGTLRLDDLAFQADFPPCVSIK